MSTNPQLVGQVSARKSIEYPFYLWQNRLQLSNHILSPLAGVDWLENDDVFLIQVPCYDADARQQSNVRQQSSASAADTAESAILLATGGTHSLRLLSSCIGFS